MSILVGVVGNKFWSNSEHKFPNSFPTYEKEALLEKNRPNLVDFLSGTIYLYGDEWNHCLYEGVYYHLEIYRIIDTRKKYCLYHLTRDLWMDVLKERPRVVGDLSNSNNDELLEKNLNRTIPVIDNPARVVTINFADIDFDWRKGFTFKESNKDLVQTVLTKREYDKFVQASHSPFAEKWKKIDKQYYSGSKNPAVYILATLERASIKDGWKHLLRTKINEFVRSIPGEGGKELKIGKVTVQNAAGNRLQGNYCITARVEGIAQGEENLRLKNIDLSGLEDIVPINFHDLKEMEPFVPILGGNKDGLFDIADSPEKFKYPFLAKVRRKIRTPIGASASRRPEFNAKVGYQWSFAPKDCNWRGFEPQEVIWSVEGKKGKGFLWWVDNLNFTLEYDDQDPGYHMGRRIYGDQPPEQGWFASNSLYRKGYVGEDEKDRLNWFITSHPIPWVAYDRDPFPHVNDGLIPFGFQIFGLERPEKDWRVIKYIGDSSLTHINYFSGIKKEFFIRYAETGETWWSKLTTNINLINPSSEFIRFYLENFYFSWTAFFPGDFYPTAVLFGTGETSFRTDIWGTYAYTNYNKLFPYIITSDIYDPKTGQKAEDNPFNDSDLRYAEYRRKLDRRFRELLTIGRIELPKNLLVEKGDYFINWQEHDICKFPILDSENIKLTFPTPYGHFDSWKIWSPDAKLVPWRYLHEYGLRLDDVVKVEGSEPVFNVADENNVVLCTTYEGDIEIRIAYTFERTLYLGAGQTVESVDGKTTTKNLFTLIKKELQGLTGADGAYNGIQEIHKANILYAFYKAAGYKVKVNAGVGHWNWFNESDFSESNDQHLLFDLVGTDWYCHIRKGKISLISKNKNLFETQESRVKTLLHEQNKDLKPSLLEKINQRVRLQFLNVPYYLNWRSSFTDQDKIFLSLTTLEPTDATTSFEQYFIKVDTQFDSVYYENIAVPKLLNKSIDLTSTTSIEREKLYLDLARDKYAWQIDQDRLNIATKRYEESITRAQNELEIQRIEAFTNLGVSAATGFVGSAVALAYGGAETITRTKKAWERQKGSRAKPMLRVYDTTTRVKASKRPNIGAGIASAGANLIKGAILNHALRFPEQERRINVDKELGAAELANQSLQINTAHMDRQIKAQLALNQISNIYNNPVINERAILDEFRKKSEWHDNKELNMAYLTVFLPSDEQLIALKSFKEEYGVMCDIPDVTTNYYDGMEPDVIRYRNLDDAAIEGIENQIVRDFFKGHLLTGIKIIQTSRETYKLLTVYEYKDQILRLNSDLFTQKAEISAKDAKVKELTNKVTTIAQDTRQECAVEKTELEKQIQNIENQLNNVNEQLRKRIEELNEFKDKCSKEKDALDSEKEQWRETETKLNEAIRRVEGQKTALEDSLRKVADERDAAKIVINNLTKEKENLENQKADIERQLRECLNKVPATGEDSYFDESAIKLTDKELEMFNWRKTKPIKPKGFIDMVRPIELRIDDYASYLHLCEGSTDADTYLKEDEINLIGLKNIILAKDVKEQEKRYKELDYAEYLGRKDRIKEMMLRYKKSAMRCLAAQLNIVTEPRKTVQCADLKQMVGNGYLVDIQPDGTGGSKAEELIQEVVESLVWMRKADTDQNLLHYQPLHKFFNLLEEFENYPLIDEYEDVKNGRQLIQTARRLITNPNLAGLKAALDALNYEAWKAFGELQEEIKQDPVLEHFFVHLYPGKRIKDLYETVFQTNAEKYIAKNKFMETRCAGDFDAYEYLQDLMTTLSFDLSNLATTQQKPPTVVEYKGQLVKEHIIKPVLGNWYNGYSGAGHTIKSEIDGKFQYYIGKHYPYERNGKKYAYIYVYDSTGTELTQGYQKTYQRCAIESRYLQPSFLEQRAKDIFEWTGEAQVDDWDWDNYNINISLHGTEGIYGVNGEKNISPLKLIPNERIRIRFIRALFSFSVLAINLSTDRDAGDNWYKVWNIWSTDRSNYLTMSKEEVIKQFESSANRLYFMSFYHFADSISFMSWAYNVAIGNWKPLFTGKMSQKYTYLIELNNILK